MTVEQIVEEARSWPTQRLEELVTRLNSVLEATEPETAIDVAWKEEVRRRLAEIDSGAVAAIPGEQVSARVRKLLGR